MDGLGTSCFEYGALQSYNPENYSTSGEWELSNVDTGSILQALGTLALHSNSGNQSSDNLKNPSVRDVS